MTRARGRKQAIHKLSTVPVTAIHSRPGTPDTVVKTAHTQSDSHSNRQEAA